MGEKRAVRFGEIRFGYVRHESHRHTTPSFAGARHRKPVPAADVVFNILFRNLRTLIEAEMLVLAFQP
jgi:hypothetical protein